MVRKMFHKVWLFDSFVGYPCMFQFMYRLSCIFQAICRLSCIFQFICRLSCIFQFIQRQCKDLSLKNIQSLSVGQKDSHRSLFNVWHEVFSLPRPKRCVEFARLVCPYIGMVHRLYCCNYTHAKRLFFGGRLESACLVM